jgi:hypothetical protein
MSFSSPQYFSNAARVKYRPDYPGYDKAEHWSKTLERRPVGKKYGKGNTPSMIEVDFNTHIDMFDDNEILDKEIT